MNLYSENKKHTVTISKVLLGLLMCCGLITGILPRTVVDIAIVAICMGLLITGDLILAYPFMLFYYGTFGLIAGVSTYRIFSLLLLANTFLKLTKRINARLSVFPPILVYMLYLLIVLSNYSIQRAVFCMLDIVCVLSILRFLNESSDNVRSFFKQFAIAAVFSVASGVILGNALQEGSEWTEQIIYRFSATFEDPNYMGFFLTISIFATVIMKLFSPMIRWGIIAVCYGAILASASMTALLVNIILWLIYLMVAKKINVKVAAICLMVIGLVLIVYQYGVQNPDAPLVGATAYRIQSKLQALEAGDMTEVTTKRSDLAKEHWQYFLTLSPMRKLFGGGMVNTIHLSEGFTAAAHNEYVDLLLNVGVLGAVVLLGYMVYSSIRQLMLYRRTKDETHLCLLITKCVWFAYGMTLTVFLDFRFMLPFFI